MKQKASQKSKAKESSQKSVKSSKVVPTEPAEPPAVNGHRDSQAESSTSPSQPKVDLTAIAEMAEEKKKDVAAIENVDEQPDTSQAQENVVTNTVAKVASDTSEEHNSKTRGQTQDEEESEEVESAGTNPSTSQKRKAADVPVPASPVPVKRGRGKKAAAPSTKTKATLHKQTEDKHEALAAKESGDAKTSAKSNPASSRRRKATEATDPVPSTSGKSQKTASGKTKAKRQKMELSIPHLKVFSGRVFVVGENDVGQLGFGEEVEVRKRPALLDLPSPIVDVVAGGMHSVCLTEGGEVLTFGCNDEGALGRVTSEEGSECIPRKVDIPERVVQVSAGDSHTAALAESGQVYAWGNFRCGDGHLGLTPDESKQVKPVKILSEVVMVKIASGSDHLVCLSRDGTVYTCGCGDTGQLGRLSERFCKDGGRKGRAALLAPAAVLNVGRSSTPFSDIWTGAYATFLKAQESGRVYAFGLNNYNQLGFENESITYFPKYVPSFNDKSWRQISGGQHHTLALDSDGQVHAIGRCDYGRLGLGEDSGETSVPTPIPTLSSETCTEISCGNCVSFALNEQGAVHSWGFGTSHQLGHGNDEDCHVPTRIEGNFFASWKAHKVCGGGQHTLILASPKESTAK